MTKRDVQEIAETLNFAMAINVTDEQSRKNIAIAMGQMLRNKVNFNLDIFVMRATFDSSKVKV